MKKILLLISVLFALLNANDFKEIKEAYYKSYDYEKVGRYKEAIKILAPLYKKYPNGYTLNLRFGWLFFLNKNYNDAITYYNKAALLSPYSIKPKLGLMRIYLNSYQYQKAESIGYKILKIDFYNYYANLYTIKALILQKKYDYALPMTKKMLSLYPTDISFLEQLAIIYKATNSKYLKKVYQDILILDPNNLLVQKDIKSILN